ncbi:MAG: Fic/DOC family N-terminal domain-containing protein [Actinomycetota bacterium]|nr:Fic/DOC family N-terminal domain-containing protein [Actinomycetota bacterium]
MGAVHYHEGRFPPRQIDWERLIPLVGPSSAAVARFDGLLRAMPNPDVLLSPLTTNEAVLSSRIEGTQATMGEVLEYEAGRKAAHEARREDIQEVLNYRAAVREAQRQLETMPLSGRVIKEAHRVLLEGVRGTYKSPGRYRTDQNWIGAPGCTIETARFVPVDPDRLEDAMARWEQYLHAEQPDRLVQLAVVHAEFEALHPFLDGNGRVGRMIVPLFMWQAGLIHRPIFYISAYFEARRDEYYDRLLAVSRDDDWTGWCAFFLEGVRVQAEDNLARASAIMRLYEEMKVRLPELTRSPQVIGVLDLIFQLPVFSKSDFVNRVGVSEPAARRLLKVLRNADIVSEVEAAAGSRAGVFAFEELLDVAEGAARS